MVINQMEVQLDRVKIKRAERIEAENMNKIGSIEK